MRTIINIKYIMIALAAIIGLGACNDAEDPIENMVYLSESIGLEKTTVFVIPDEGKQVRITPRLAKAMDRDIEVEVYVKTDALDDYNKAYGTTYQIMADGRYTILNKKVVIPAGKVAGDFVAIDLDPLIPDENKSGFTYALPLAVRPVDNNLPVLESASTYYYAAQPVPMADVPQFQKYCILQMPLAQDYESEDWTFETLFNANKFTGKSSPTWLATAMGYNTAGGSGIANGFMLRLGDANVMGNILNGRIQFAGKGTATTGLQAGIWHHVAIVSSKKTVTVYLDGSPLYSIAAGLDKVKFVAEQGLRLAGEDRTGTNISTTTRYRYSQVRLWGEARTAEQLKNNMYGVPEDSPNLWGYWKLDNYTTGKTNVNKGDKDLTVDGEKMEIDTYFFKDYTGKNPDAFVDRNPTYNSGGLLFDTNKRIEIGYPY